METVLFYLLVLLAFIPPTHLLFKFNRWSDEGRALRGSLHILPAIMSPGLLWLEMPVWQTVAFVGWILLQLMPLGWFRRIENRLFDRGGGLS